MKALNKKTISIASLAVFALTFFVGSSNILVNARVLKTHSQKTCQDFKEELTVSLENWADKAISNGVWWSVYDQKQVQYADRNRIKFNSGFQVRMDKLIQDAEAKVGELSVYDCNAGSKTGVISLYNEGFALITQDVSSIKSYFNDASIILHRPLN